MSMHIYRGFEIHPLIYPHVPAPNGSTRHYDAGADAAVKICLRDTAGDARRASRRHAENLIDGNRETPRFFSNAR